LQEILGHERRRRWSEDEKARIVAESFRGGASVSWVARRHGLSPSQLFAWRKAAKEAMVSRKSSAALLPVEIVESSCGERLASAPTAERVEIAFPNGRHLFVSPALGRRLLEALIEAVAAT
jgi:transposase